MANDELRRAEENDRLDWLADGAARATAGDSPANPVLEANENAWREYDLTQAIPPNRETFDQGWDAAIEYMALDKHIGLMLAAFDRWNHSRGQDPETDEARFRAFLQTLAPLRNTQRA